MTQLREVVEYEPLPTPIGRFGGVASTALPATPATMCIGGGHGLAAGSELVS